LVKVRVRMLWNFASRRRHERPERDHRTIGNVRVGLVGRQHPVDQVDAVGATARRHQDEGAVDLLHLVRRVGVQRHLAAQVAGVDRLMAHRRRHIDAGQRLVDLRQAVDPDLVVEVDQRRHDMLALPFGRQHGRIVHDIAQPEHQGRAAVLEQPQRRADLAAQAERLLVDDKEVGPVDIGGIADDAGAHLERVFDADPKVGRVVFAGVDLLDHARDAHEIDARVELVGADHGRARDDQHRHGRVGLDDGIGNGAAAAYMAETEGIVAVDQHTL
jgi:hypothetical protein